MWRRLYRQEYRVGLKNPENEYGEMYMYFVNKQIFNPFKIWITDPINSPTRGIIENEV